jgi:hypothetical protein
VCQGIGHSYDSTSLAKPLAVQAKKQGVRRGLDRHLLDSEQRRVVRNLEEGGHCCHIKSWRDKLPGDAKMLAGKLLAKWVSSNSASWSGMPWFGSGQIPGAQAAGAQPGHWRLTYYEMEQRYVWGFGLHVLEVLGAEAEQVQRDMAALE